MKSWEVDIKLGIDLDDFMKMIKPFFISEEEIDAEDFLNELKK